MPLSAHVVNSEVVPRTLGTSEAGASLQPPPRSELGAVGGPSVAPVPIVPQPGVSGLIPPAGTSARFTDRRSVRSESEDDMQSVHSRRSERSRRSAYESGSEREHSTERADLVLSPAPQQLEVEEERRRRRDRELADARDTEIRDLVQRTRYLTTEVEEFVESMGGTVL